MEIKKKHVFYFLLLYTICIQNCASQELIELHNNYEIQIDGNSAWYGQTNIVTLYGNKENVEHHFIAYVPEEVSNLTLELGFTTYDNLIGDIEFYVDGKQRNFDDYFELKKSNDNFYVESKNLTFRETSHLMLKYSTIQSVDSIITEDKTTSFLRTVTFTLEDYQLYEEFIFKIPTIESGNLNLKITESSLTYPNGIVQLIPIAQVIETDNFVEVSSIFWAQELSNSLNVKTKYPLVQYELNPKEAHTLNMRFSYDYTDKQNIWGLLSVLCSLVALFAFYGGTLWARKNQ